MSKYWVAMWTLRPESAGEAEREAMAAVLKHVREEHPSVLSVRTWTVVWGAEPARPGRIWMEEFASLTAIDEADAKETTPTCKAVWDRIYELAVPGTFRTAIWSDPLREEWKG